jgi:hypothetical protein
MGIEATGTIKVIGETTKVSERFSKRQLVLELADNPKYPQLVEFQLTGDRCANLDGFSIGDEVRVEFSLRGREWRSPSGEVKYFNSLDVWAVDAAGERRQTRRGPGGKQSAPQTQGAPQQESLVDDDIPFIDCSLAHENHTPKSWRQAP